ncbi:MAG: hypothetical protein KGJ85_14550, partial [Betaproteobacteria bacterium]|nr:hypothetical protein [Betaproteobacteria bacterium]
MAGVETWESDDFIVAHPCRAGSCPGSGRRARQAKKNRPKAVFRNRPPEGGAVPTRSTGVDQNWWRMPKPRPDDEPPAVGAKP